MKKRLFKDIVVTILLITMIFGTHITAHADNTFNAWWDNDYPYIAWGSVIDWADIYTFELYSGDKLVKKCNAIYPRCDFGNDLMTLYGKSNVYFKVTASSSTYQTSITSSPIQVNWQSWFWKNFKADNEHNYNSGYWKDGEWHWWWQSNETTGTSYKAPSSYGTAVQHTNVKQAASVGYWTGGPGNWYWTRTDGGTLPAWIVYNNESYYILKNGRMAYGWLYEKGIWYYLNDWKDLTMPEGVSLTGWQRFGEDWYYFFAENGTTNQGAKYLRGQMATDIIIYGNYVDMYGKWNGR